MYLEDVEVLAEGLAFPEGPVVMPDGSVVVVEIEGGRVTRWSRDDGVSLVAYVGGGPNGAAIGPDGALYVCNNGGRSPEHVGPACIQRVDPATGGVALLYEACDGEPLVSPNDIVFDSTGNFWFTDFRSGRIHYASPDGRSIEGLIDGASTPNGIGLSADESILYWAQTNTRQIFRRRLEGPGRLAPSPGYGYAALRTHGTMETEILMAGLCGGAQPDSLAIDSRGCVCVGTIVEGGIAVVSPDGEVEHMLLPDHLYDGAVTNICFGGPDLRTAYITASITGRLLSARWPCPGQPLAF